MDLTMWGPWAQDLVGALSAEVKKTLITLGLSGAKLSHISPKLIIRFGFDDFFDWFGLKHIIL